MRLDHIAYRAKDRRRTADFFERAFGYKIGTEFQIEFDDKSKADCLALVPPEVRHPDTSQLQPSIMLHRRFLLVMAAKVLSLGIGGRKEGG